MGNIVAYFINIAKTNVIVGGKDSKYILSL
jgi:hypothetical protein